MSMMICKNTNSGLKKINESAGGSQEYILEGIFAELGVMNVNHRIYPEDEYLKHLQYLRDDIKKGEPLLGELDHPDDRFDVRMQEASHQIIDLWYEPNKKVVMGKIRLLNTPNGKIAQSIVDQGIPLHISSRAAGTVNPQTNIVSIDQIYTYDIVAKPGFAKAVLHRVNESTDGVKYTDDAMNFLKKSEEKEKVNEASKFGILDESVFAESVSANATLRKEALDIKDENKEININDMTKHINEAEGTVEEKEQSAENMAPEEPQLVMAEGKDDAEQGDESKEGTESTPDEESEEKDKKEKDDKNSDESSYEILSVEAVTDDDSKDSEDSDSSDSDESGDEESGDDESSEEEKSDDKDDKSKSEDSDKKEDSENECKDTPKATVECGDGKCKDGKCDKKEATLLVDKKKEIEVKQKNVEKKLDVLINKVKKNNKCSESVHVELVKEYPFTAFMNESELVKFSVLNDGQREKVANYLNENQIYDTTSINNTWTNALTTKQKVEPVWLRMADKDYREMYEAASPAVKESLKETAKFLIFESKEDVDDFWMNSGLKDMTERNQIYESYMNTLPKIQKQEEPVLPYSQKDIEFIGELAMQYNKR